MGNTETLNDLIRINNDRVSGYNKAALQTEDNNLRTEFKEMSEQSRQFASELRGLVNEEGKEPAEGTTVSGKIYRTWMDVKATFAGKDRKSLLSSCEFGEDAAQRAYVSALKEDDVAPGIRNTIQSQQNSLKQSHDRIKRMRDEEPSS